MKCSYFNYIPTSHNYNKYVQGYIIEINQANFRRAIIRAQQGTAETWYTPDTPLFTFYDNTEIYPAIMKSIGNNPIYYFKPAFKMKGTGSIIFPGTSSQGMGTMDDTNSFVNRAYIQGYRYAVGFTYENHHDYNSFTFGTMSAEGGLAWWGLTDYTYQEYNAQGSSVGAALHFPLIEPDMITTLKAIVRDNEKEKVNSSPYTGGDADNGGGDGDYGNPGEGVFYFRGSEVTWRYVNGAYVLGMKS